MPFKNIRTQYIKYIQFPQLVDIYSPNECYNANTMLAQVIHIQNSVENFVIDKTMADIITECLKYGSYTLVIDKYLDLVLYSPIVWNTTSELTLVSKKSILIDAPIINQQQGVLILKSGIGDHYNQGTVSFTIRGSIAMGDKSLIEIYYNPVNSEEAHKFHSPYDYSQHIMSEGILNSYMLVNDIYDLQDIIYFLSGNYALSRDIEANITLTWNHGKGFKPIFHKGRDIPFSGHFDGNGYTIKNLYIARLQDDDIGLFSSILGTESSHIQIKNLNLENLHVEGHHRVGGLAGNAVYTDFINIELNNITINGSDVNGAVGGLIATLAYSKLSDTVFLHNIQVSTNQCSGELIGIVKESEIYLENNITDLIGCS